MAERFTVLIKNTNMQVSDECPIIILGYSLLLDNSKQKKILQVKMQNIGEKKIAKCRVKASDGLDDAIAENVFEDKFIETDEIFGSQKAIYVPEETSEDVKPYIDWIQFEDETEWEGYAEWTEMPEPKELFSDDELLAEQYKTEIGEDSKYVPNFEKGIFQCTCGTISMGDVCRKCGKNFDSISEILFDLDGLRSRAEARKKEEEEKKLEEAKRLEEEEAAKQLKKKKKKKTLLTSLAIALVVLIGAGAAVFFFVIKPANEFQAAGALFSQGRYEEAKPMYDALKDYQNSPTYATYCQAQIDLAAGRWSEAEEEFGSLGNIWNCADMIKETRYRRAKYFLDNNQLDVAEQAFKDLGNYSDSATMLQEIAYRRAIALYEDKQYEKAVAAFEELGTYSDSETQVKESKYQYGKSLIGKSNPLIGEVFKAFNAFNEIDGYSDSQSQANKALEKLINLHLNSFVADCFPKSLNSSQQLLAYNTVVAYINKNIEWDYWEWREGNPNSHATNVAALLTKFPAGFEERDSLLNFFNALKNYSGDYWKFYPQNKKAVDDVWDTALRENVMNDEWSICEFLKGHWTTYSGNYYFDMEFVEPSDGEKSGHFTFRSDLPMVSKPSGTEYFGINNYILVWETKDNKELAKVYDLTMDEPDQIAIYCYQNDSTYTLYRRK